MASTITSELSIVGELKSDGDIEINGRVDGGISGRTVTIGERGHVKGTVMAESVRILGGIEGEIGAVNVALECTAIVNAHITYRTLSMESGAFFVGQVHGTGSDEPSG